MRTAQKPTLELKNKDPLSDSVERHPAYGQIGASRVSGQAQLYGSDFEHNHYVTIRLYKSELHRGHSNDHPMTKGGEVMEVSLSESQWATFVSSLNTGFGVQCTINYLDGKSVPRIEREVNRRAQFEAELNERLKETESRLIDIMTKVDGLKVSQKAKDDLKQELKVALQNMGPNLNFTRDQFGEYMEDVTQKAKAEINAYAQHMLERYAANGRRELAEGETPIRMLEGQVEGEIIEEK